MNAVLRLLALVVVLSSVFICIWSQPWTMSFVPAGLFSESEVAHVSTAPPVRAVIPPLRTEEEIAALVILGEDLYLSDRMQCAICHGQEGDGMVGPSLLDHPWLKEAKRTNFHRVVTVGLGEDVMPGVQATERETDAIRLFLQKLSEEYAE